MKIVFVFLMAICWCVQIVSAQTVDYTYDAAGNMIQRTVIILSPMMADTTDNNHSPPDPDMGSTAQVTESSTEETTNTDEPVTSRTGRHTFNLYPNPTRGLVEVEAAHTFMELEGKQVQVFDLAGRELYSRSVDEERFTLDFSAYTDGTYIVRITAGDYLHEMRVIKQ